MYINMRNPNVEIRFFGTYDSFNPFANIVKNIKNIFFHITKTLHFIV